MGTILFTQYVLPNGERRLTSIERPDDICVLAGELRDAGYRFETEILRTREVAIEVCADNEHGDPVYGDMTVVPNGPDVPLAIDKVIRNTHAAWKKRIGAGL